MFVSLKSHVEVTIPLCVVHGVLVGDCVTRVEIAQYCQCHMLRLRDLHCLFCHVRTQKRWLYMNQSKLSDTKSVKCPDLGTSSTRTMKSKFLLFISHSVYDGFVTATVSWIMQIYYSKVISWDHLRRLYVLSCSYMLLASKRKLSINSNFCVLLQKIYIAILDKEFLLWTQLPCITHHALNNERNCESCITYGSIHFLSVVWTVSSRKHRGNCMENTKMFSDLFKKTDFEG